MGQSVPVLNFLKLYDIIFNKLVRKVKTLEEENETDYSDSLL